MKKLEKQEYEIPQIEMLITRVECGFDGSYYTSDNPEVIVDDDDEIDGDDIFS
jgi:hypothetical protein